MKRIIVIVILVFLVGCAANQEVQNKIDKLDTQNSRNAQDIDNLRARLDYLEEKLEQVGDNSILEEKIQDLEIKIRNIEDALRKMSEPPKVEEDTPRQLTSTEIEIQYQQGLLLFESRLYQEAIGVFQELLTMEVEEQDADNMIFWIGECYYSLGDNVNALEHYQQVIDKFGDKSNKYYDSLFKKATIYAGMGRKEEAKEILQMIINNTNADYYNYEKVKSLLDKIK